MSDCVLLKPSEDRWITFISSAPQATIFHHPAWINLLAECYRYRPFVIGVCDANGDLCAGLPVVEVNSILARRRWGALPFSDHCMPLARDEAALDCLTDALVDISQHEGAPRFQVRWSLPPRPAIRPYSLYVLHTLKLDPDAAAIGRRFDRTNRQNVRTARKREVRIEFGTEHAHMRQFYDLQLQTRHRKGVPVQPRRFFDRLAEDVIGRGLGFVLLAYNSDQCIAAMVYLHWGKTLVAKYAASREDALQLRPNNLLFWEGIRWGCEHGYTLFDMGRTDLSNEGLRRFKVGWGADEVPLTYSVLYASVPQLADGRLTGAVQAIIRRSPVWVCRAAGELLYRYFA
ncbi:MAG: GNAT family N-acetyltransferase [Anaerolineae bacterium]|jgi:CelD/BcsL family acetyltransferase involved in cellulose biosynthesis|nr:GNAT family N-acetyltransferase [Anaerolineae bacterium]